MVTINNRTFNHHLKAGFDGVFRNLTVWVMLAACCLLVSCSARNSEQLHVRIQNASETDIKAFWLGAGSGSGGPGSRAFGSIPSGQTTDYHRLKAEFGSYSNYNFITEDGNHFSGSVIANEDIGIVELEPGSYTFVVTIVENTAYITILMDDVQ